jgi:dTDP-glucose 4,6-dehydratase
MTKRVLITGAGGFVGHHFLEHVLSATNFEAVCTDSFRHKGRTDRIQQVLESAPGFQYAGPGYVHVPTWQERTSVITHDLNAPFSLGQIEELQGVDYMVCFASESHVDRSISDPVPFIRNNTEVALNSLELARKIKPKAVLWVSTDEVYGPVEEWDEIGHDEWSATLPSNPYSASKASQEAIAISYWRTYGVPLIIVNCMNMIGERQDPEKFVPMVISKVLKGETVTIHGTPDHVGTRHYLHSRNLADGILHLLTMRSPALFKSFVKYSEDSGLGRVWEGFTADRPDRYNVSAPDRIDNLTLAQMIAEDIGKPLIYQMEDFHSTRPGHDPHYGLDPEKMAATGWEMPVPFRESLRHTVEWTLKHPEWLKSE